MTGDLTARLQQSLGDGFPIERELGGGGMSRVFLATERALERRIVVKVLDLEGAVEASAERFRREVKVIAQLQHPHVVPVLSAGGDGTLLWYAMPFVSGESLRARLLREGALPLDDALRIARELFDALAAAHARGIVHRDIKPENILLEGRHAVVADFGVAKALAEAGVDTGLTAAGLALGTPAYMAPEQAMADPTTNHRADLYAAGAVLYEMLVGAPPFSGNAQAVVAAHLTAPVPNIEERRGDVPAAVAQLIRRLMAKNPAERPQGAQEVLTSLESMTTPGGSTLAATAAGAPAVARPATGRRRLLVAGAFMVAIVVAAAWFSLARDGTRTAYAEDADVIAVIPLGSTGDSALARLGRDLVVTVSASLDGVGALRAVDAMSVLQRSSLLPQPISLEAARSLGRSLGARSVIQGSLIPEGPLVRVDVGLYSVDDGSALARISARAAPDSVHTLTDSLTVQLLRQIWKRGTPPSAMLAEVATANAEALKAFLEGEAAYNRLDIGRSVDALYRAVRFDSTFALAWVRLDWLRTGYLLGPDTVVTAKARELEGRLPLRDQEIRRADRLTDWHARLATYRQVAAKYPEFYQAQYLAGDLIVHDGPLHGEPIADARPYFTRLDALAPRNADNALHRYFIAQALGDTVEMLAAAREMVERAGGGPDGTLNTVASDLERYFSSGTFPDSVESMRMFRAAWQAARGQEADWYFLLAAPGLTRPGEWESVLRRLARDPEFIPKKAELAVGLGATQFQRGEIAGALRTLAPLDTMAGASEHRSLAARSAAAAAWLGLLPVEEADVVLAAARRRIPAPSAPTLRDLHWSDAAIGIAAGDSARVERAARLLADTTLEGRIVARGVRALWRERRTGNADSLIAAVDASMAAAVFYAPAAPLERMAVARALIRTGAPDGVDRYLRWTDGVLTGWRPNLARITIGSYSAYERAVAAEAAGDRAAAIRNLQLFIRSTDKAPPGLLQQRTDAEERLARLVSTVR